MSASARRRWTLLKRAPGMAAFYGLRPALRWVYERVICGRPVSR